MTPWLLVLVPLAGAALGALVRRAPTVLSAGALVTTAALGLWAAATRAESVLAWGPRLELSLAATDFARVMVVLVPVIALPIVLYAAATEVVGRTRLITLLTAFVGVMELLVLATDLLTLLLGWELVGALSWLLIAHDAESPTSGQNATHAFITTRFGDLGLYVAAASAFASTGSFAFAQLAGADEISLQLVAGGILLAAAAKSAQVPFSPWLFAAMAGPTPVSALLHSSTMVAAGAYLLVRLAPHLDAVAWFAPAVIAVGAASALAGGLVASVQRHPKRLLAASTTAQYGLMFTAVGAGSPFAAAAQLVTHAAFKALLFLTAGTATHTAGSDDLAQMRLGRRLPAIAALAGLGALALAAVPPLGGAWSKEQILVAAFESSTLLGAAVVVAGILSAYYALRYWLLAYGPGTASAPARVPRLGASAIALLAALTLALGALWLSLVNEPAARLISGEIAHAGYLELALGLAGIVAVAALIVALDRRQLLVAGVPAAAATELTAGWFAIPALSRRLVVGPVLLTSRALARFDDQVIDAGIRASARVASAFSRLLQHRSELSIDAVVDTIAGGTLAVASRSSAADDHGVDRTAEGIARGIGRAGAVLRRLQSGLSHHYYVIVAIGVTGLVAALAMGTS